MLNSIGWELVTDVLGQHWYNLQEQEDEANMLSKVLLTNNQPTPHKIPE